MIDYLGTKGHFKNPNCLKNGITQNVVEVVATDDTVKVCAFKEIPGFCILNKVFPIVFQPKIACSRQLFLAFSSFEKSIPLDLRIPTCCSMVRGLLFIAVYKRSDPPAVLRDANGFCWCKGISSFSFHQTK